MGDVLDMAVVITATGTRSEALSFMELYKQECEQAYPNVLYMAGYIDPVMAKRVRQMFARPEGELH